jgi:hypothetical protein
MVVIFAFALAILAVDVAWVSAKPSDGIPRSSTPATDKPTLLGSSTAATQETFGIRPDIVPLSGDGTAFVGGPGWQEHGQRISSFGRIAWASFGGSKASGRGLMWLNDCTPDCAEGRFQHYPAKIQASSIREHHYTRLIVTFKTGSRATTGTYVLQTGPSPSWRLQA